MIVYQGAFASGFRVVKFAKTSIVDGKLVLINLLENEILHEDFQGYIDEFGLRPLDKAKNINKWEPKYEYV